MILSLRNGFDVLSLREKIMVAIAGLLAVGIVAVFLIAIPLIEGIKTKQQEYIMALEKRTALEARIAAIKAAPPITAAAADDANGSLQMLISQSAAEAGFALDRADSPAADIVDIAMAKARPQALMVWLNDWEARGIVIRRVDIKAANDDTVSITASLRRPAR